VRTAVALFQVEYMSIDFSMPKGPFNEESPSIVRRLTASRWLLRPRLSLDGPQTEFAVSGYTVVASAR
jgi:hypothetical protein